MIPAGEQQVKNFRKGRLKRLRLDKEGKGGGGGPAYNSQTSNSKNNNHEESDTQLKGLCLTKLQKAKNSQFTGL